MQQSKRFEATETFSVVRVEAKLGESFGSEKWCGRAIGRAILVEQMHSWASNDAVVRRLREALDDG